MDANLGWVDHTTPRHASRLSRLGSAGDSRGMTNDRSAWIHDIFNVNSQRAESVRVASDSLVVMHPQSSVSKSK